MRKKITALFAIFFFQFVVSSCVVDCGCSEAGTYNQVFSDVDIKGWDTSGFSNSEVTDSVSRKTFGLSVYVHTKSTRVAFASPKFNLSAFGFASAYACSCVPNEYIIVDPIETFVITTTNTQTNETMDVTQDFIAYSYGDTELTNSELIANLNEWGGYFELDMIDNENIPERATFTVTITMETGVQLVETTKEVVFK